MTNTVKCLPKVIYRTPGICGLLEGSCWKVIQKNKATVSRLRDKREWGIGHTCSERYIEITDQKTMEHLNQIIFSGPFRLYFPIIFTTVEVITENSKHWWSWSLEQSLSHTVESCSTHTTQQYYFLLATIAIKAATWSSRELNKVQVIQKKSEDKQEEFLNFTKKKKNWDNYPFVLPLLTLTFWFVCYTDLT